MSKGQKAFLVVVLICIVFNILYEFIGEMNILTFLIIWSMAIISLPLLLLDDDD